eukprot:CAMPEP_0194074766 /NCGR_PEP_ID=MMETSP0149-20130528/1841_1 /TAXON_ID=122233 /ORGANISM="Chaetoceros debilis, Strain MM31A-1" /LENGTH=333 /DNA_ID=CAMNT_0038755035 /DNA_START=92 /DNA_END=1093 /DNA_ORIENTATION=-
MYFYSFLQRFSLLLLISHRKLLAKADDDVKFGDMGSITCPDGYQQIKLSKWACIAAMGIGDPTLDGNQNAERYKGEEDESSFPAGCYECPSWTNSCPKGTWFNEHPTGSENSRARPYCAKDSLSLESPEKGIIFMGDSDVDYWRDSRETLPGSFNYGIAGHTCNQVLQDFKSLLETTNDISWMILVCGENDLYGSAGANKVFRRFKQIYREARKNDIRIIMMGTKPEPDTTNLHQKYRKYDKKLKKWAQKKAKNTDQPPFIFVDSYKAFEELGNPDSLYADDELHLSAEGYSYWNGWLKNAYSYGQENEEDYDYEGGCYSWQNDECIGNIYDL